MGMCIIVRVFCKEIKPATADIKVHYSNLLLFTNEKFVTPRAEGIGDKAASPLGVWTAGDTFSVSYGDLSFILLKLQKFYTAV